jgi:hypothetical protein
MCPLFCWKKAEPDRIETRRGKVNGVTFATGRQCGGHQRLNSNDMVRIGWNEFRFVDEDESAMEKTAYILD